MRVEVIATFAKRLPWQTFNWIQLPVCDYLMNIWWNINLLLWMPGLVFIWLAISEDWFMVKFLFLCFFLWFFLFNPSWWHTRLRLMLLAWAEQHHCLLAVLETLWNNICKDLSHLIWKPIKWWTFIFYIWKPINCRTFIFYSL